MRTAFIATALALACLPAAAQQQMKPGLWEVQTKMNNPQMDQAMAQMQQQMASMPPEQRKQMEAMMAQRGVKMMPSASGMTMQVCMTKEQVERNEVPQQQGDCKHTITQRSGSTMKMTFTCASPPSSGEGEFTSSSDGYTSRMTVTSAAQGKPETTTINSSGKWMSADCGSVKPVVVPKK